MNLGADMGATVLSSAARGRIRSWLCPRPIAADDDAGGPEGVPMAPDDGAGRDAGGPEGVGVARRFGHR